MKMTLSFLLFFLFLASCGSSDDDSSSIEIPQEEDLRLEMLTNRTAVIWGLDFLPDERIIFTERSGGIFILNPETQDGSQVSNVPEVSNVGEGGMLDLELHPGFSTNSQVYFCYTEAGGNGRAITLGKGTLQNSALTNVEAIFRSNEANSSSIHFGCRIEFQNNQSLFLSIGDQSEPSKAQDSSSHLGKILRMNEDGSGVEVWSSGHRNVQGLAIRPGTEELFASEHGPVGGDELNLIQQGGNFGWPLVTRGEPPGPLGESAPGFLDPITSWSPAIAPSGMTFWRGNLFIGTLRGEHIRRISLDGTEVTNEELLFEGQGIRFRNIQEGPDGLLYFSTDDGRIGRIQNQ